MDVKTDQKPKTLGDPSPTPGGESQPPSVPTEKDIKENKLPTHPEKGAGYLDPDHPILSGKKSAGYPDPDNKNVPGSIIKGHPADFTPTPSKTEKLLAAQNEKLDRLILFTDKYLAVWEKIEKTLSNIR